jgi:hypothetical protein
VFVDKVFRKIYGSVKDEVSEQFRKLHNKKLHQLYRSLSDVRKVKYRSVRWAGYVAKMGYTRNAYRILVGKRLVNSTCKTEEQLKG